MVCYIKIVYPLQYLHKVSCRKQTIPANLDPAERSADGRFPLALPPQTNGFQIAFYVDPNRDLNGLTVTIIDSTKTYNTWFHTLRNLRNIYGG